jgi:glycyl-tRNA synthetase beta chain
VEAVVEARPTCWAEFPRRLDAVRAFKALPESQPLAAANKRVGNILKKSEEKVAPVTDATLFVEPAERALADALEAVAPRSQQAFDAGDYTGSLQALAALKAPVDAFFDTVMVNADDPRLRANRLGLMSRLHAAMNRVADLSKLAA